MSAHPASGEADRCETCRFWARDPNAHGNTKIFDCRRHAPMFHGVYRTHWCQTRAEDWCGEYQPLLQERNQ